MKWLGSTFIAARPRMLNLGVKLAGNILNQCAAEKHVQALSSVADGKDGFGVGEGMFK